MVFVKGEDIAEVGIEEGEVIRGRVEAIEGAHEAYLAKCRSPDVVFAIAIDDPNPTGLLAGGRFIAIVMIGMTGVEVDAVDARALGRGPYVTGVVGIEADHFIR